MRTAAASRDRLLCTTSSFNRTATRLGTSADRGRTRRNEGSGRSSTSKAGSGSTAAVRIDTLVVTAPPDGSTEPYRATTFRFDRVRDGDRLPFDDLLIHEGPVGRFLDLAVWVARDDQRDLDLADLLADAAGGAEVQGAVATLAGLAVAAPQAALVAGAAGAVGTLVRVGARALDAVQGRSIGVYRTSLLPHQRLGAGREPPGVGRHPAKGVIRAQDLSFSFEVVDLERT